MGLSIKNTFESPNIRSVFKAEHGQIGYSVVSVLVKRFMDSFGFSTKMSDTQIEVLTVDTLEKFSFETLEDIILFFKMARTGKFGTTMRGVDSNLIFGEWYPMYLELKAEYREIEYQKEKVKQTVNPLSIEDIKKAYDKIQNKGIFRQKVSNYVDKITEGITRQELEDIISEWKQDDTKKLYLDIIRLKRLIIKGDFKFKDEI